MKGPGRSGPGAPQGDGRIAAAFCDTDTSWVLASGETVPGLRFADIRWCPIETTVAMPVGAEDDGVVRLMAYPFVDAARRAVSCTGGAYRRGTGTFRGRSTRRSILR
jgi:hypothetical protein